MSRSPTSRLSKLSLENMPPITRSQAAPPPSSSGNGQDSERGEEEDYDDGPVRSPTTGLTYGVERLDDEAQEMVRELFRQPAADESPQMVLEWCGFSNDRTCTPSSCARRCRAPSASVAGQPQCPRRSATAWTAASAPAATWSG